MALFEKKEKQRRHGLMDAFEVEQYFDRFYSSGHDKLDADVLTCINIIGDMLGSLTIQLWRNTENGDRRVINELSRKVDIYPYQDLPRCLWVKKIVQEIYLKGQCFVQPEYRLGYLTDLVILEKATYDGNYVYWQGKRIKPSKLLHFSFGDYNGVDRLREIIKSNHEIDKLMHEFLIGKHNPKTLVFVDSEVETLSDREQKEKILKKFYTVDPNQPAVLPMGYVEVKQLNSLKLQDLGLVDVQNLNKKRVANFFGLPLFLLGLGTFNIDEFNNFITTKIRPKAKAIEQVLTQLLTSPDLYFKMNINSLYQYDLGVKLNIANQGVASGWLNGNEAREFLGFSTKDLPSLNEHHALENYIPLSESGNQKKLKGGEE